MATWCCSDSTYNAIIELHLDIRKPPAQKFARAALIKVIFFLIEISRLRSILLRYARNDRGKFQQGTSSLLLRLFGLVLYDNVKFRGRARRRARPLKTIFYFNYLSSAKYFIVRTICEVYEFSLSYQATTLTRVVPSPIGIHLVWVASNSEP